MSHYPWSESGKELLKELQLRIDIYGGRKVLAHDIEQENKRCITNSWQPHEVNDLLRNRFDMEAASRVIGRSVGACDAKLKQLKRVTKLKRELFK